MANRFWVGLNLLLTLGMLAACNGGVASPVTKTPMRILIAGSLMIPFDALEKAYEAEHPDIDLEMEAHGSIQVIRHVAEVHELADMVVSADAALIPMLMYAAKSPETGKPYADWHIRFATNNLGLAYTAKSKFADEITPDNWYKIIARAGVKVGIADPRFDAAGYRALMALQLAKAAYRKPTIFEDVILGQFKTPITLQTEPSRAVIHVPEILETKPASNIVIRGASIQLIALLESGDLDYAFEYASVIQQHKLQLVALPDAVNLGAEQLAAQYAQVQVQLDFQRFASVKPVFDGQVIQYGLTIPSNAPHPQQAEAFAAYVLGAKGQAVLRAQQQPLITPPRADRLDALPAALKPLCAPM